MSTNSDSDPTRELTMCRPLDNWFLIKEEVHQKIGFGKVTIGGKNLGADAIQVMRSVTTVCAEHDIFYGGEKIVGAPSLWQLLSDSLGVGRLTTRPNGVRQFLLAYSGYRNYVESVGYQVEATVLNPFRMGIYGVDPIPDAQLYNNPKIHFESTGGRGVLKAFALYDRPSRRLEQIREADISKLTPYLPPDVLMTPAP